LPFAGGQARRGLTIAVLLMALVLPCFGSIAVDPGAQPMVWHVLGASTVLAILNWRKLGAFLGEHAGLQSVRASGFVFATAYALATIPLALSLFGGQPMPRFNDIFLVGIVLTVYFFSWQPAAYLLAVSILASAWILPPNGTLRVEGFAEWYRLISFSVLSAFMILLLTRLKARQDTRMHSAASGD